MYELDTPIASINLNKVASSPIKAPNELQSGQPKICFCKALSFTFHIYRIAGCFPITWKHVNGTCVFKGSYLWLAYSLLTCVGFVVQLFVSTDLLNFHKDKPLPELLSTINEIMYLLFVVMLSFLNIMRYPKFVQTLNNLVPILYESKLLCQSALHTFRNIQSGLIALIVLYVSVEYIVMTYLHYSDKYNTNFSYNIFLNRTIQYIPFFFYLQFFTLCYLFITILACFERLSIKVLKFSPVHPLDDIDETNNKHTFLGTITYLICTEEHKSSGKMLEYRQPELVEYLRHLHEKISLAMYDINKCFNPQLLFHTVVELTVLIIHWYEVIIYTSYDFETPYASTINVFNWMFVLGHTIGLFLFLKIAQEMKNMVHGFLTFLLEYSTRISDGEEHQQVRIFIEKLEQHRPLTASGVFNLDLGIAGPISANILTYVLVALQFDIPKS